MAKRRKAQAVLLAGFDDCLLGVCYPRAGESGIPVAVYSADMIAARLRDDGNMTSADARSFVADQIEGEWIGPGTPRIVWAASAIDFGVQPDPPTPPQTA
jgi:hypothetical protein